MVIGKSYFFFINLIFYDKLLKSHLNKAIKEIFQTLWDWKTPPKLIKLKLVYIIDAKYRNSLSFLIINLSY